MPRPGQLVLSVAGRDVGRRYLVLKAPERGFLLVTDGRLRTVAHPKQKNLRHLQLTPWRDEHLGDRLEQGTAADAEVVQAIARLGAEEERARVRCPRTT